MPSFIRCETNRKSFNEARGTKFIITAGYGFGEAEKLFYDYTLGCGEIKDGIGLRHGDHRGGWVVSLKDMERICREVREEINNREKLN